MTNASYIPKLCNNYITFQYWILPLEPISLNIFLTCINVIHYSISQNLSVIHCVIKLYFLCTKLCINVKRR